MPPILCVLESTIKDFKSQEMRTALNTSNYRPEPKEQSHIGTEQKMFCGSHSTGSTKIQANRPEGFSRVQV